MRSARKLLSLFIGVIVAILLARGLPACPFCETPGPTLADEIGTAKAAAIAILTSRPAEKSPDELPRSRFRIVEVLKGLEAVGKTTEIDVLHVGDEPVGTRFFVTADEGDVLVWSRPIATSQVAERYLRSLGSLPAQGPDRLRFFLPHLESKEAWLSGDAYDEFAKAPYADVKALKSHLQRDPLLAGITNREMSVQLRRLYLTLLGVCGTDADLPQLESLIQTTDRDLKPTLDAVIACYLTLRGADGLPFVEKQVLTRDDVELIDIYAAVGALRFHGEEEKRIDRRRLGESLKLLISRPVTAGMVIPDLARWQDWSAIDPLVKLFGEVEGSSAWIRLPIVQYLHACPLPEAKTQLEGLKAIDAQAVRLGTSPLPLARRPSNPAASKRLRDDTE